MPSDTYAFCALVCAPIPVGHTVELSWLQTPDGGFFGSKSKRLAHVKDLDTGISFGEMECFEEVLGVRPEVRPLELSVRSDLEVKERVRGRVVACQVATMGFSEKFIQTTLVVEPTDEPYR